MKPLDRPNRRPDAAVDDILEELKGKGKPLPQASDDVLAGILAEMGLETDPQPYRRPTPKAPPKAAPTPKPPVVKEEPAAAPTAPVEAAVAPPAPAVAEAPPAAHLPAEEAPAAEDLSHTLSGTRRLPIWDEEAQSVPIEHRVGKAAALEHVETGKFEGDEELASWFAGVDSAGLSKKEQKQAEREQKRQMREELRRQKAAEKAARKAGRDVPDIEDPEAPDENLRRLDEVLETMTQEKEARTAAPPEADPAPATASQVPVEEDRSSPPAADTPAPAAPIPEPTRPAPPRPAAPPVDGRAASLTQAVAQGIASTDTAIIGRAELEAARAARTFAGDGTRSYSPAGAPATTEEAPMTAAEATRVFDAPNADSAANEAQEPGATQVFTTPAEGPAGDIEAPGKTQVFTAGAADDLSATRGVRTRQFEPAHEEGGKVPTAAFTQEFDNPPVSGDTAEKSLYVDEMVDDRFREFFGETVIVEREELEEERRARFRTKKSRTALLTGEFTKLTEQAETEDDEDFEDYSRPQDASLVENDLVALGRTLVRRAVLSGIAGVLLLWMAFGFTGVLPLPAFAAPAESPLVFCIAYLVLLLGVIILNFTTVATGLIGLAGAPTVDTPAALASVAALLQGVVLTVQLLTQQPAAATLFGGLAALLLAFNAVGKRVRATSILENFRMASGGLEHSAAYVLDGGQEAAYHITKGLEEEDPSILISRPTALVKGFLRQSFSLRWSDGIGRILGWILLLAGIATGAISYVISKDLMAAISCLAATLCIGAPLSSTLVSGIPSRLLQASTGKIGAVVPGWSAIEELGNVNVVMAGARDIFPPKSVYLKGIKTFEQERIDLAILYAASVLVEGCDTLRDMFLAVIQGKSEMLYKVDNLMPEPGKGFTAWVENNRIVLGSREMLQKYAIEPPPVEMEMKYTDEGNLPVYLAVSGRLFAMFIVSYAPDAEVQGTLDGLIKSGVSLLIKSDDMNVTDALIERVYQLPSGVVKVLGKRELQLLEPLQSYLPESEGVMTHIGTFTSFIGGMRAAAGCASSERMSSIVQIASAALAALLCLLLVFSGGLADLSISIALLYQLGWTILVSVLPFARRY